MEQKTNGKAGRQATTITLANVINCYNFTSKQLLTATTNHWTNCIWITQAHSATVPCIDYSFWLNSLPICCHFEEICYRKNSNNWVTMWNVRDSLKVISCLRLTLSTVTTAWWNIPYKSSLSASLSLIVVNWMVIFRKIFFLYDTIRGKDCWAFYVAWI